MPRRSISAPNRAGCRTEAPADCREPTSGDALAHADESLARVVRRGAAVAHVLRHFGVVCRFVAPGQPGASTPALGLRATRYDRRPWERCARVILPSCEAKQTRDHNNDRDDDDASE